MRRGRLAALAAAALLAACRPAGPPPTVRAPAGLPGSEPMVRVGIAVDATEVEVGAAAPFEIALAGGDVVHRAGAEERWVFTATGAGLLEGRGPGGRRIGPFESALRVQARDGEQPVKIAGQAFRGGALIRPARPGRLTAINVLELETYLLGVVPREIGPRPAAEIEAVKAQAIAARTYAIGHLGRRNAQGFDFYATIADQVYGGVASEDATASRAVRETRGEILTYQGVPILAYYHSTCGGRTAAIDEVWRHAPVPYLRSVSDAVPGREGQFYCEPSNRFRWTQGWDGQRLRAILSESLSGRPGGRAIRRVEEVEVVGRTPSGRAGALRITADGRTVTIPGDSIRRVLRPEHGDPRLLNSTLFELEAERAGGEVRTLQARGGGWGHGIGMCQFGAIGRARAGQSYRQILTTYYRDTDIVRLY